MANTVIQLKYSSVTGQPPTLNTAEPAYSSLSGVLWIDDGTGVVAIGGKSYTEIIDARDSADTANTLVLRDANGDFSAGVINADLNGKFANARTIAISGDVTGNASFDGSQDITINVDLSTTGVTAGDYGGSTSVPTFTVDAEGRISYAANVSISTSLDIAGDTGTDTIALGTDTLTFAGGDGIDTVIDSGTNTVTINVDNTVFRTTGGTISGDLAVTGNLIIAGETITQDVTKITTEDSMIKLAANNAGDAIDIGFYGEYNDGSAKFTGLVRDQADGVWKLFTDYGSDPTANDVSWGTDVRATLDANFTGGNVSSLFSAISVTDGGTGFRTANTGDLIYGTGSNTLGKLVKPGSDSILKMASDGTPSWIDTLDVDMGGTGATSFTQNYVLLGNGTSALQEVGSSTEGHLLTINASGVPTFAMLSGGSF